MSRSLPNANLAVLVPAYNEASTVKQVVEEVLAQPMVKQLIVVDDASTDGTAGVLAQLAGMNSQIKLLRHEHNQGKGAAIRTAIPHIAAEITVIQDADLEYSPSEYPQLVDPITRGLADAVFGSRFIGGQAHRVLYFWHMAGNRLLTLLSNMKTNLNLTDMECGHKAFLSEKLKALQLRESGFGIEPELAAQAARMGLRVYEVGVAYSGRTYAEGKKITWRDGYRAIGAILRS
jgi:glycosyltransferase involved in cell wall biosynthesis